MIAIVNTSTVISDAQGALMVRGLNVILPKYCKDWSLPMYTATYVGLGKTTQIPIKVFILDSSDVKGALGYHGLIAGVPYGKCFAKTVLSYGVLFYSNDHTIPTFAQCLAHEVFELLVDPLCNCWWDIGDQHTLFARETCDPVQGNVVVVDIVLAASKKVYNMLARKTVVIPPVIQKIGLSDWVLPSWGNPHGKGPFNHLNTLQAPFTIDKNGYGIQLVSCLGDQTCTVKFGEDVKEEHKARYINKRRVLKRKI
jgi:hypothetical protein